MKKEKIITFASSLLISFFILGYFIDLNEIYYNVANAIFSGVILIFLGILSIRIVYVKSKIRYLLGIVFLTWGFSCLLILSSYFYGEIVFNIAYSLIGLSAIFSSICLQLCYFLKTRENKSALDEKFRYINMFDSLTGIYNRNYCELLLEELEQNLQEPLSIIFGDLNNLKLINDIFGHQAGDDIIIKTADIMKTAAAESKESIVARWGGDEFIIILPKTNYTHAQKIINIIKNLTKEYKTDDFPIDIALGISTKENPNQTIHHTIKLADTALYKNKFRESSQSKKTLIEYFKRMLFENEIKSKEHALKVQELALLISKEMTRSKVYKEALSKDDALKEIERLSGIQFDPNIASIFVRIMK